MVRYSAMNGHSFGGLVDAPQDRCLFGKTYLLLVLCKSRIREIGEAF